MGVLIYRYRSLCLDLSCMLTTPAIVTNGVQCCKSVVHEDLPLCSHFQGLKQSLLKLIIFFLLRHAGQIHCKLLHQRVLVTPFRNALSQLPKIAVLFSILC